MSAKNIGEGLHISKDGSDKSSWMNTYEHLLTAAIEYQSLEEKIHKLEQVSGHDIDTLVSLFAAGYDLKKSKQKKTGLCPECKGSGYVQIAPSARGIKQCPVCNGPKLRVR